MSMILEAQLQTSTITPSITPSITPPKRSVQATQTNRNHLVQEWLDAFYASQFADLQKSYQVATPQALAAFLRTHSQLYPVLHEALGVIPLFFGIGTPILLTLQHDPEAGLEYVIAWLQTDLAEQEAVERFFEFTDAWYIDQSEAVRDLLHFNLS